LKLTLNDLDVSKPSDVLGVLQAEKKRKDLLRELKLELQAASTTDFSDFQKTGLRIFKRPDIFAREYVRWPEGEKLTAYQEELLLAIPTKERIAVRGPRGLGKSCLAALAVLWFCLSRESLGVDYKCIITAGSANQLRRYLFPEIRKWALRLDFDKIGRPKFCERSELLKDALQMSHGEAFCVSPDQPSLLEGLHASEVLVVIDEAKTVCDEIFHSVEGFFSSAGKDSGKHAFAIAISTPSIPVGMFYRLHRREPGLTHWHARHVKLDEALAAGTITQEYVDRLAAQFGKDSSFFQQQVLGEFAADDDSGIISLDWILRACDRYEEELENA
jgi:hypothetical protein